MATVAAPGAGRVPSHPEKRPDEYAVVGSDRSLGLNLPQRLGNTLWGPMFAMSLMAFPAAFIVGVVRANELTGTNDPETVARLQHVGAALMFVGFLAVFSAITFAIARILGAFRDGGGKVQETAGVHVQTLKMPLTAKGMIAFMAMGMMLIVVPVVLHFVVAASVVGPGEADLLSSERWFTALEGIRRFGIVNYLFGITLGLATIIQVLRFQAVRIREVADEAGTTAQPH